MTGKRKILLFYTASVLIPALLLTVALAVAGAVPFGGNTMIWSDSQIQYVDFFTYLRTVFSGENNLIYSFSKNLGGEMLSLLSYYLLSPFNVLFAFATNETLPQWYTLVMVLKLSVCGMTFFHSCTRRYGCRSIHLAFSTAYALMAYNVMYGWSLMWLDGVMVLPLMAMGLEELWQGKTPWWYVVSLSYALLTNFYIGYMLCIAAVLFSLVHMALMEGTLRCRALGFGRFMGFSCIGGLSSAFLWLPAFLGLLEGRAQAESEAAALMFNFNVFKLPGKLVAGASSPTQVVVGSPHIFCSTLVLVLVLLFLLSRKIPGKYRLAVLGVLGILMVSFILRPLNIVWHGFSPNYAFNFRYAFIFNYVMILTARYALTRVDLMNRRLLFLAFGLVAAVFGYVFLLKGPLDLEYFSLAGWVISLAALALVTGLLLAGKQSRGVCLALILVSVVELGANCALSWRAVTSVPEMELLRTAEYHQFHKTLSPAVESVKAADSGFYRMEKDFFRDRNDAMFYGYNGLSHFSSSQQKSVLPLMEKMGFNNYKNIWAAYHTGSTAEADSLLGVKYLLSREDRAGTKGYELLTTLGDVGIYRNPWALPIAMAANEEILSVDMGESDYFALHNTIWQSLTGEQAPILTPAQYSVTLENLVTIPQEDGSTRYVREVETQPAALCFTISVTQEKPLYYYFTAPGAQDASIYVNGRDDGYYFHELRWDMTNAGTYAPGELLQIRVVLNSDQMVLDQALFYYEDLDMLAQHAARVTEYPVALQRESSSHVSGSFTAREGQVLLFTIPYDTGWQLYVDGQRTEFVPVLDALMAAPVSEGEHTFEMRYVPRGAVLGLAVSLAAVATAIGYGCMKKRKEEETHE